MNDQRPRKITRFRELRSPSAADPARSGAVSRTLLAVAGAAGVVHLVTDQAMIADRTAGPADTEEPVGGRLSGMNSEPPAYRSDLNIGTSTGDGLGPPEAPGPVTDAVDPVLRELRRRAVDPVVASLISADELDELSVHWGVGGDPGDVWVRLAARGELFQDLLSSSTWEGAERAGPARLAERLADHLEDWVCETRFAWGERRIARYTLPDS